MMPWLLAQSAPQDTAQALARQAAETQADLPALNPWPLVVGVCGVVAVVATWLVTAWYLALRRPRPVGRPWRLFFQLARAHRLAWRDTWLLHRLACRLELQQPALLFVQPENFAPSRLEDWPSNRIARLAQLRERLFQGLGQPPPAEAEQPASSPVPDPSAVMPEDPGGPSAAEPGASP